ncbi:hypothetical protein GWD52_07105 [Enterobacteriaceae bacterium 4M9]|nr:hypothetical protein [Enterobacteriaceae bacterium 4M9]
MYMFAKNAKMIGWSTEIEPGQVLSILAVDMNTEVPDDKLDYKVGLGMFASVRNNELLNPDYASWPFYNPATCPLNVVGRRNIEIYSTPAYAIESVREFLEFQRENIAIYQSLVDDGIITADSFILPANGMMFTSSTLRVDVYDNDGNAVEDSRQEFQLDAVPVPWVSGQ